MRTCSLWLAIVPILYLAPSPASAGMPRLKKTSETIVTSIPDGVNIVKETRTVSIQNTQVSDALQVVATMSATEGSLPLEITQPTVAIGTVPGSTTVTSSGTYEVRRGINPACPLCSPWDTASCQACGLDGGSITALITELPPAAPVTTLSSVTNTSLSGTINACTRNGSPYPTCIQQVRLVPHGSPCTANPIAFTFAMSSAAQSWTITGLSPSTSYGVCGAAGHDATVPAVVSQPRKGSTTPNRAPNKPILTATSPNNRTISGTMSLCDDDDLPLPAACIRTVKVVHANQGCNDAPIASTLVTGTSWQIVSSIDFNPLTSYRVYGISSDGLTSTCSDPGSVTVPRTMAGCVKHAAFESGAVPNQQCTGTGCFIRGISANWKMRALVAVDVQYWGFSQAAVWLGTSEKTYSQDWVEAGVTRGFEGNDVYRYFSARGEPDGDFFERQLSTVTVPSIGQAISARIINCALNPPGEGCSTPWNSQTSPYETIAKVNGLSFTWDTTLVIPDYTAPGPGGKAAAAGIESTCNVADAAPGSPSRANTTTFRQIEYRHLNQGWAVFSVLDPILTKYPTSTIHGVECCYGLQSGQTNKCNSPVDVLAYLNTLTQKVCEQ